MAHLGQYVYFPPRRLSFYERERMIQDLANIAQRTNGFAAPTIIKQHPYDFSHAVDLGDDHVETTRGLFFGPVGVQKQFGAAANHAHRRADLVRQSRRQRADRRQALSMLQFAFERELAAMSLKQVAARGFQLLIKSAEFLGQQRDFISRARLIAQFVARKTDYLG